MTSPQFAFVASTGRTATMFMAATLNRLSNVVALHEGQDVTTSPPTTRLPLINIQNRRAWHDPRFAATTVADRRAREQLRVAAGGNQLLIDVAFYNAPLLVPLAEHHEGCMKLVVFRRCETFVRSATIVYGEDLQPAGWPDPSKCLTDREKFIGLARLRPHRSSPEAEHWDGWSAVQRNIWLWCTVNRHLLSAVNGPLGVVPLQYEELVESPAAFWSTTLSTLRLRTPENLKTCVECSESKVNQRSSYHVGPAGTWTRAERSLYETTALPLEAEIYAR